MTRDLPRRAFFEEPDSLPAEPEPFFLPGRGGAMDLGDIGRMIWRGRVPVAMTMAAALGLVLVHTLVFATPLYRATSVVVLDPAETAILDMEGLVSGLSGDDVEINTELEVMRSRLLLGQVLDRLGLLADPEFNADLVPPGRIGGLIRRVWPEAEGADPELEARRSRDRTIEALQERIGARVRPRTFVFDITVASEDPLKAALIADAVAARYVASQLEAKRASMDQVTSWLTERVADLQGQLETAEVARARFSAATDLVSAEALAMLEVQLKDLRDRIAELDQRRGAAEARRVTLEAAETRDARAGVAEDVALERLLGREDGAAAFDARFAQLLAAAEADVLRMDAQRLALTASERELEARIEAQGADLIRLQQLVREAEAIRLLYEQLLTRLNGAVAQQGIQQPDSRILSTATVPRAPSSPRTGLMAASALILGFFAGLAIVLARHTLHRGLRTSSDLEETTGRVVAGEVPLIPGQGRREVLAHLRDHPQSAQAEAIRALRTSVMMLDPARPPRTIAVTSSVPAEGKTTTALALADNIARLGRSVIVVEGDIRRRVFDLYFDDLPKEGLAEHLSGDLPAEVLIARPAAFGADVMHGGSAPGNPADLLSSARFDRLLESLAERYDFVILDTPPVLAVPDFRIVAPRFDSLLLCVRWDATTRVQVAESLRLLRGVPGRRLGLVLSRVDPRGMRRYGHAERLGAYDGYGTEYYRA